MKNTIILLSLSASLAVASTQVSYQYAKKDYANSRFKTDGLTQVLIASYKNQTQKFIAQYSKDEVNLEKHPLSDRLEVEKYGVLYAQNISNNINLKGSYLTIDDNLAPTDSGEIYSLGITYNIAKGFDSKVDIYKSDYETFDVNQYDLSISKGIKITSIKSKITAIVKSIQIDGDTYNGNDPLPKQYDFYKKEYLTYGLKLGFNYQGYKLGLGTFIGKRLFGVFNDGLKVQHHAMEQDKTYMINFGKSFQSFDLSIAYNYQNGVELPEKQKDVDTKVTSFQLAYRF